MSKGYKGFDMPQTGYHKCELMPDNEFMEKQNTFWHIHKTDEKHSSYRKDIKDGVCPYCKEKLEGGK